MLLWVNCLGVLISAVGIWMSTWIVNPKTPQIARNCLWMNLFTFWFCLTCGFWNFLDTYWN